MVLFVVLSCRKQNRNEMPEHCSLRFALIYNSAMYLFYGMTKLTSFIKYRFVFGVMFREFRPDGLL